MVFGVTAESAQKAEELIFEEVFHNQTIPRFPSTEAMDLRQVKRLFPEVSLKNVSQKGIWYLS